VIKIGGILNHHKVGTNNTWTAIPTYPEIEGTFSKI
jgi:hypothetical protein